MTIIMINHYKKKFDIGYSGAYEYFSFLWHCRYNYTKIFYRTTADFEKHMKWEQKNIFSRYVRKNVKNFLDSSDKHSFYVIFYNLTRVLVGIV